ncbi:MAG: iron-binding protein [Epsilonproteobacteria bacterium]|nr:iron-binding protein [Campylobacterota bacterium]
MKKHEIFKSKHELWLSFLFGAFSVKSDALFEVLYDFAMIEFRHLSWLGDELVACGDGFDFEKGEIDFMGTDYTMLFEKLKNNIQKTQSYYQEGEMYARFRSDENYFMQKLEILSQQESEKITAFDKKRVLEGFSLDQEQMDALTLFLFEESYKEYELILVYMYANFYTDSKLLSTIFIDLIYESQFHLKSFARMMRSLGLLSIPRTVMESIYKFDDLETFLVEGIKEEEGAKEECLKLARAVNHPELSNFFNFINFQENYHIALMQKALKHIRGEDLE